MSMMVMLLFLFFLLRSCSEVKESEEDCDAFSICRSSRNVDASMIAVGMISTHMVFAITM